MYRSGSLTAEDRELARFSGCTGGEVEQKGRGKSRGLYSIFNGKGNENHQLGTGFLYITE
jgi:hypothetical protein